MVRIFIIILSFIALLANSQEHSFGLQEKTGSFLPDSIYVFNEDSVPVSLSSLIDGPVLFVPMYHTCTDECPAMMEGLVELINFSKRIPEKEYRIICMSINHGELTNNVRDTKKRCMNQVNKTSSPYFWRFITADSSTIQKICRLAGWEFRPTGTGFIHTTSSFLITPKGMISQYFYGTYFNYMHFDMSVEQARMEIVQPTRLKNLKYCTSVVIDKNSRISITTTIFGITMVAVVVSLFIFLWFKK